MADGSQEWFSLAQLERVAPAVVTVEEAVAGAVAAV